MSDDELFPRPDAILLVNAKLSQSPDCVVGVILHTEMLPDVFFPCPLIQYCEVRIDAESQIQVKLGLVPVWDSFLVEQACDHPFTLGPDIVTPGGLMDAVLQVPFGVEALFLPSSGVAIVGED